jgi:Domain of unknown function (DUF4261)
MGLFDIFKKKSQGTPPQQPQSEIIPNQPELQFVSLFFENKPTINKEQILQELKSRFNEVNSAERESPLAFFFPEYMIPLKDATIPAQGAVIEIDQKPNLDRFEKAFQQSWHWDSSKSVMEKCNFEVNLTDLMSRTLPHQARLEYFQKFICAVVRATNPTVIYFRNSDKLLEPTDFLEACDSEQGSFLHGAMNVRMFNVSNGEKGETLMDTVGLHAFGIADFECIFSGHNPGEIAGALQNLAYYVFETGDYIRSNSTVQGVGKNPIWKTKYADSKVEPSRLVVEVIPN